MTQTQFGGLDLPPFLKQLIRNIRSILLLILAFILVWSAFFQVEPEEVGVITRFGKYTTSVQPGLNFKLPLIDKVTKVPVERQQKLEFGFRTISANVKSEYTKNGTSDESLMLTGDLNLADVEWVVQYRIEDPYQYLFIVRNPESTLRDISESTMRQVVGDRTVNEVLTVGRAEIAETVKNLMQEICQEYSLYLKSRGLDTIITYNCME